MDTKTIQRRYDLDWLRVLAILTCLLLPLDALLQPVGLARQESGHLCLGASHREFHGDLDDAIDLPHLWREYLLCHEQGWRRQILQGQSPTPARPPAGGSLHLCLPAGLPGASHTRTVQRLVLPISAALFRGRLYGRRHGQLRLCRHAHVVCDDPVHVLRDVLSALPLVEGKWAKRAGQNRQPLRLHLDPMAGAGFPARSSCIRSRIPIGRSAQVVGASCSTSSSCWTGL